MRGGATIFAATQATLTPGMGTQAHQLNDKSLKWDALHFDPSSNPKLRAHTAGGSELSYGNFGSENMPTARTPLVLLGRPADMQLADSGSFLEP